MRSVSYRLVDLKNVKINLGFQGENEHTTVVFDCKKAFDQYPDAVCSLSVISPHGEKYPAITTREGNYVLWVVTDSDLAYHGDGMLQLSFMQGSVVKKTYRAKTYIDESIIAGDNPPSGVENWLDTANQTLEELPTTAKQYALSALDEMTVDAEELPAGSEPEVEKTVDPDTGAINLNFKIPGGGSGTTDYDDLENKPAIGGVELDGDKTLHELGIAAESAIPDVSGKANLAVIAPAFNQATANDPGSLVTYTDGVVYVLPDGHAAGATWANTTKTATNIAEQQRALLNSIDGVNDNIEQVTEDYGHQTGWNDVQLANPLDVKAHYRCADTVGNQVSKTSSGTTGFNSSSVTTCIVHAFDCEANKKYRLIVTNGQSPASIAERGTIVIAEDYDNTKYKVKERFRYSNTANAQDIFEFTPSYAGHVYFNLDANYQSISVKVEAELGTGKTALDKVARSGLNSVEQFVFNSDITPELIFESGDFDYTLADGTGTGYRSQIIEGVKDCAICIKVNPTYTAMYGNGTDELVTVHGSFVYHSTRDNVRLWVSDTVANSGLEVRIYKEKGHRGIYDVIVAASDSAASDKAIADIVCDGSHDEIDLQFAVNWNVCRKNLNTKRDSCNVLLLPGNYTIDAFETKETLHGDDTVAQYAVMVGNDQFSGANGYCYSASIHGTSDQGHLSGGAIARINVSNSALSTLSENVENVLIGVCRAGTRYGGGIHMNAICIEVKNLSIYTNGINNKIIALDGYTAGGSVFENNDIWSVASTGGITPTAISQIPTGSIGIRAGDGSCYGVRQSVKGNRIQGFREGVAITGEHFVVQDNLELRCTYGFTTNMYEHNGANQHPNVFIGNSVEQCYIMGKLGTYTGKQTLVYIGGSVENMIDNEGGEPVAMLPIEVSNDSKYRGRIESDSLADPYNESMFESGKGINFEQIIYPYNQA